MWLFQWKLIKIKQKLQLILLSVLSSQVWLVANILQGRTFPLLSKVLSGSFRVDTTVLARAIEVGWECLKVGKISMVPNSAHVILPSPSYLPFLPLLDLFVCHLSFFYPFSRPTACLSLWNTPSPTQLSVCMQYLKWCIVQYKSQ